MELLEVERKVTHMSVMTNILPGGGGGGSIPYEDLYDPSKYNVTYTSLSKAAYTDIQKSALLDCTYCRFTGHVSNTSSVYFVGVFSAFNKSSGGAYGSAVWQIKLITCNSNTYMGQFITPIFEVDKIPSFNAYYSEISAQGELVVEKWTKK